MVLTGEALIQRLVEENAISLPRGVNTQIENNPAKLDAVIRDNQKALDAAGVDLNKDGKITMWEFGQAMKKVDLNPMIVLHADTNHDGKVDHQEMTKFLNAALPSRGGNAR